jgi:hypothetical protein
MSQYNATQSAWLQNTQHWLDEVGKVDPNYAHSDGVKQALGAQAKALEIDPADIVDAPSGTTASTSKQPDDAQVQTASTSKQSDQSQGNANASSHDEHDNSVSGTSSSSNSQQQSGPVDENGFRTKGQDKEPSAEERAQFASKLADHLKERYHLTDEQVAGVMGNLMIEGRFASNMREGAHHGSDSGFGGGPSDSRGMGIAQWTGMAQNGGEKERGRLFMEFCEQNGLDMNSESANVKFLDHELDGTFKGAAADLRGASSTKEATDVWLNEVEKPTMPNPETRYTFAQHWADFKNGKPDAFMNDLVDF